MAYLKPLTRRHGTRNANRENIMFVCDTLPAGERRAPTNRIPVRRYLRDGYERCGSSEIRYMVFFLSFFDSRFSA